MDGLREFLNSILGKTVTSLILVFLIGVIAAWNLPQYIVTTTAFSQEKSQIYSNITLVQLKVLEIEKQGLERRIWELEALADRGITETQRLRLQGMQQELIRLKQEETTLKQKILNGN